MTECDIEAASAVRSKAVQRGVDFVTLCLLDVDAACAELMLETLARRLDRPLDAVARDVASGEPFPGRPSWL